MLEKLSLDGKTIVITGGGTGLGREMSVAMAKAGADLVIASRRMGPIEETAEAVREQGRRAIAVSTDVTDSGQVNALFERAIDEFGKVDVLFNNAGIVRGQGSIPIWDIIRRGLAHRHRHEPHRRVLLLTRDRPAHDRARRRQDRECVVRLRLSRRAR